MRPQLRDRLHKLVAAVAPAELRVRDIAAVTIGIAEIVLAGMGESVELVVGLLLGEPVALVLGEIELLQCRVPIHPDDLANPAGHHFHAAAVEVDAADLGVGRRRHADVARRADVEIELVVRPDGQKLPAMRLVVRQIAIDEGRLRRVVELALDIVDLRDLVDLGDVERTVVEGDAVGRMQPARQHLDLTLAVLVDQRIDLVEQTAADENGALVADPQRARIADPAGIDLDMEVRGQFQLGLRQLVGGGGDRRRKDRRDVRDRRVVRPALRP